MARLATTAVAAPLGLTEGLVKSYSRPAALGSEVSKLCGCRGRCGSQRLFLLRPQDISGLGRTLWGCSTSDWGGGPAVGSGFLIHWTFNQRDAVVLSGHKVAIWSAGRKL